LWGYLRAIQASAGVTILLTTHLMDEADRCARLAILNQGKLVACDPPTALKECIGGDVITLTCTTAAADVAARIERIFGLRPERIEQTLRLERERGHQFVPELIEALPGLIASVSVGKPTLEDVFIRLTGRGFKSWEKVSATLASH
jgi:ABC-2 type transport system ATP-binding protein